MNLPTPPPFVSIEPRDPPAGLLRALQGRMRGLARALNIRGELLGRDLILRARFYRDGSVALVYDAPMSPKDANLELPRPL